MTCKDCIHYDVCIIVEHRVDENEDHLTEFGCEDFINKNDVVEVVHGEWIPVPTQTSDGWRDCDTGESVYPEYCSICGDVYVHGPYNYCPNCGAKMDKKKKGI